MTRRQVDVVVVGGGAAGLEVAVGVRRRAPDARVLLVSDIPDQVYRPWLIYLPHRRVEEDALRIPLRTVGRHHGFETLTATVRSVDTDAVTVTTDAETIACEQLVIAAGAPADRRRIPGADEHALFPCELGDARVLAARLDEERPARIVFVLAGERVGPGLEYCAWLVRGAVEAGRSTELTVVVENAADVAYLSPRGATRYAEVVRSAGGRVVRTGTGVRIGPSSVTLADGRVLRSDLTAVVGPLRGPDLAFTPDVTDERGHLVVDDTLRCAGRPRVHVAGDALTRPGQPWRPSWLLSVRQAETVAENVATALHGRAARPFDPAAGRRLARISVPDIGGDAFFVVGSHLLANGPIIQRLRRRMDRLHFARYPLGHRTKRRPA